MRIRAPSSLQPIFGRGGGAAKDRLYSEAEVAAALDSYATSNSLQVQLVTCCWFVCVTCLDQIDDAFLGLLTSLCTLVLHTRASAHVEM